MNDQKFGCVERRFIEMRANSPSKRKNSVVIYPQNVYTNDNTHGVKRKIG